MSMARWFATTIVVVWMVTACGSADGGEVARSGAGENADAESVPSQGDVDRCDLSDFIGSVCPPEFRACYTQGGACGTVSTPCSCCGAHVCDSAGFECVSGVIESVWTSGCAL